MSNFDLHPDEVILYEGQVSCKQYKGNLQVTLTSHKLVFEKEKGLFKKERELIDTFFLETIKFYNEAAQIKQKGRYGRNSDRSKEPHAYLFWDV